MEHQKSNIIKEVKKHAFYVKPGEKKRIKQALARKRSRKKMRRQPSTECKTEDEPDDAYDITICMHARIVRCTRELSQS